MVYCVHATKKPTVTSPILFFGGTAIPLTAGGDDFGGFRKILS